MDRRTPDEVVTLLKAGSPDSFLRDFALSLTNAATAEQWRSWAFEVLTASQHRTNGSIASSGVSLQTNEVPTFLPNPSSLVGTAVILGDHTNSYINLRWGGHDTFYGVMVGTLSFRAPKGNNLLINVAPGIYVYLTTAGSP